MRLVYPSFPGLPNRENEWRIGGGGGTKANQYRRGVLRLIKIETTPGIGRGPRPLCGLQNLGVTAHVQMEHMADRV